MTTAQDNSRADFERELIANRHFKPSDFCFLSGDYTGNDDVQFAWAVWQAARALPGRGVDPMLDTPAGMEPVARVCQGAGSNIQWRKGMTYADLPAIDGQDLYTAAQVQAMGRMPPEWQAVPMESTRTMKAAGRQALKGAADCTSTGQAVIVFEAMCAAAPRPPAAPTTEPQAPTTGAGSVTAGAAQEPKPKEPHQFPPLDQVNRPYVPTSHAAYYLAYAQQTMREQHMLGTYDPRIRPIKRGNRLLWPVAGIKAVLGVSG